jgi:hypothetical protein
MNDLPRQTLSRIIAKHGTGICDAPKRLEALLRDLCGAQRREINIIMGALEERVAADLIATGNAVPRDVLFARLAARLRDNLAYTPEAARWGVETWAVALGVLSEAELQERARTKALEDNKSNADVRATRPTGANPQTASPQRPPQQQRQRATTNAPLPQPSQPSPPQSVRPNRARRMPNLPPDTTVPEPPQQDVLPPPQSGRRPRRGFTLRGCVIMLTLIVLLIVAAVFIVPAIIMVLREEQSQPSINDPRIR